MEMKIWRWLIPSTRSTRKRKNPDWSSGKRSKKNSSDKAKSENSKSSEEYDSNRYIYSGAAYDPNYAKITQEVEGVAVEEEDVLLGFDFDEDEAETKQMLGQTEAISSNAQVKELEKQVQDAEAKVEIGDSPKPLKSGEVFNFDYLGDDGKPKPSIAELVYRSTEAARAKGAESGANSAKAVFENETAFYATTPNAQKPASAVLSVGQEPFVDLSHTSKDEFEELFNYMGQASRARELEASYSCSTQGAQKKEEPQSHNTNGYSHVAAHAGPCLGSGERHKASYKDEILKSHTELINDECVGYVQRFLDSKSKEEEGKSKSGVASFQL